MQGSLAFIKTRYNLAVAAAKVQNFPCIEQGMSNKVARAGKFVAFRGFSWQVASKSMASVAHQAASGGKSHGDLRKFSRFFHYRFTRKAYLQRLFGPRGARKAPFDCDSSPHRPTLRTDLPHLP